MGRTSQLMIFVLAAAIVSDAGPAHAYIDPGTGSILLQGLVGGAATCLVLIRFYGARAKQKLAAMFGRGQSDIGDRTNTPE